MFSPFRVTATDASGKVLETRDVCDSHEKLDAEAELRQMYPDAEIRSEPR